MNVICIGFYDKFSRFFLGIKKELKKENPNLQFKILSLNFSGYLYSLLRFTPSSLYPFKAWLNVLFNNKKYSEIIKNNLTYKNIDFHSCIDFHIRINKKINQKHLLLQALSYIDILHKEFTDFNPDVLLIIGDSRLFIEVSKKMASQFDTKVYFIEQGPFNTTFFDEKGVNANASIKTFQIKEKTNFTEQQKKDIYNYANKSKPIKYNRSALYRFIDLTLERMLSSSILYPPDLKHTDTFPKLRLAKNSKKGVFKEQNNSKIFLMVLQVPMDVNMIYHSPHFKNHFSMVKEIHENLPNNSKLILREHPIYKNKYEKKLYEYCKKHSLSFDENTSLKKSLSIADVIIVNNSTVGIEAIAINKTVVVLGHCYYNNPKICIKYNKQDDFKALLNNALTYTPNTNHINVFLNEFFFNYLIDGFITDKNLIAAKTISNKLKLPH